MDELRTFPWASITVMLAALAVFWKVVWDYAQMKSRSMGNIGRKEFERRIKHLEIDLARAQERIFSAESRIKTLEEDL